MKFSIQTIGFALCCFLLMVGKAHAQDPRLGQYFASPMTLNPALIGKTVTDWRLLSSYRSQWQGQGTQPFTTTGISLEKNISGGSDKNILAIGLLFLSDASNGGLLKNNYLAFGAAYHNALDAEGRHLFGGGLTVNYANRILDAAKFQFQSQFGSGGFQPNVASNDGVVIPKRSYIDVNAGLTYSYRGDRSGLYTGISYFHAAKPKDGAYANTAYQVEPRLGIQAGYQLLIGEQGHAMNISAIWEQQGEYRQVTTGLLYKITVPESQLKLQSVNLGAWYRFGNTLYPYVGFEAHNWLLGVSYDIMTSKMATSTLQSFELSFGWQFGKSRNSGGQRAAVLSY